jgi:hypothetical protein
MLPQCEQPASAPYRAPRASKPAWGGYFMDEDQKDAAIGRVVREKQEAERELALLQAEARKFGEMFLALGASLNASPEYITFERQEVDIRYHSPRGNNRVYKSEEINGARLIMLTHDIRESLLRVADLSEQASKLGA